MKYVVFCDVTPFGSCKNRDNASVITVTGVGELGTKFAATGNRHTLRCNANTHIEFLPSVI
jgi:hypothetical protein